MIGSRIVYAYELSAGARKKGMDQAIGRSCGGRTSKIYAIDRRHRGKGGCSVPDARAVSGHHGSRTASAAVDPKTLYR